MDDQYRRGPLLLLAGRANRPLAAEIGERLGESAFGATVRDFADGEIFVRLDRNARGRDVFIIQPTTTPADNIMELLLLVDAAVRASAARVTAVVPYFGYGRQDRKDQPRVSIGAKLVANLIVAAGCRPAAGHRLPSTSDPGILRHPRGSPVRRARSDPVLRRHEPG